MLVAIDLTQRQAARVLEQGLQTRVRVDIEPRSQKVVLCGSLVAKERDLLRVDLHDYGHDWPLSGLVGALCEVKTTLSGQLYLFSTCIVDAIDDALPQHLLLAIPGVIQVANRRRFDRKPLNEELLIQVWPDGGTSSIQGVLLDIGHGGLSCRLPKREAEELLLIDDTIRLHFQLPGIEEPFDIPALVGVKTTSSEEQYLKIGLEFRIPPPGDPAQAVLARLHAVLSREYTGPQHKEGE